MIVKLKKLEYLKYVKLYLDLVSLIQPVTDILIIQILMCCFNLSFFLSFFLLIFGHSLNGIIFWTSAPHILLKLFFLFSFLLHDFWKIVVRFFENENLNYTEESYYVSHWHCPCWFEQMVNLSFEYKRSKPVE